MEAFENLWRTIRREGPAYIPFGLSLWPERQADERLLQFEAPIQVVRYFGSEAEDVQGGRDQWADGWGVGYQATHQELIMAFPIVHPLADITRLSDYVFPDAGAADIMDPVVHQMEKEKYVVLGWQPYLVFERAWLLMGMESFFVNIKLNPDRVRELLYGIGRYQVQIAKRYVAAGIDIAYLGDDYGWQNALMLSPDTWREFIYPQLADIVQVYKEANIPVVLHSCGHITPIISDLVEIGIDILNPIQALANDVSTIKAKYGDRLTFWGGVDTQYTLSRASPDEVRAVVRRRVKELGQGGGYIVAPDQLLPLPDENVTAFVQTAQELASASLRSTG